MFCEKVFSSSFLSLKKSENFFSLLRTGYPWLKTDSKIPKRTQELPPKSKKMNTGFDNPVTAGAGVGAT